MPSPDRVVQVVGEWVEKAENDLKVAEHILRLGRACPADAVCFHSQQCVEKYLKACLVFKGVEFARTHDIGELTALTSRRIRWTPSAEDQRRLTAYATAARYPGVYEDIPLAEARSAVRLARRVRREVRRLLPKGALLRRRPPREA